MQCVCGFLGIYFWAFADFPNLGLNRSCQFSFCLEGAPCVCLHTLNSGILALVCGVYHADRGRSGLDVSFSSIWTHAWWPVWKQAYNLPKPTQTQIWLDCNLVPTIFFYALFSWFCFSHSFLWFGCVYFNATSFLSLQFLPFVLRKHRSHSWFSVFISSIIIAPAVCIHKTFSKFPVLFYVV